MLVSDFTFAATANAVRYVDAERCSSTEIGRAGSWDPDLLSEAADGSQFPSNASTSGARGARSSRRTPLEGEHVSVGQVRRGETDLD